MHRPFALVSPATRGLSLALTRHLLRTTQFPVYATHRASQSGVQAIRQRILDGLPSSSAERLRTVYLDLTDEASIAGAAQQVADSIEPGDYMQEAFFTGGVLATERNPGQIDAERLTALFQVNVISHMLLMKHFMRFVPERSTERTHPLAKWIHVSARLGSIGDNKAGGWYSYRSSKAALNQAIKTFDHHLKMNKIPAICVGYHPGTMKTEFSRDFWGSAPAGQPFHPEDAAEKLVTNMRGMTEEHRGRVWDWRRNIVPW